MCWHAVPGVLQAKLLRAVRDARAGRDLADAVLQLKRHLEAVADADLTGEATLQVGEEAARETKQHSGKGKVVGGGAPWVCGWSAAGAPAAAAVHLYAIGRGGD